MGTMTIQKITPAGLAAVFSAVAAQDVIETGGNDRFMLLVKNGGGASINVTIPAFTTEADVAGAGLIPIPDHVVAVGAGAEKLIGPFANAYRDADGTVTVDYSATASVTSAAIKLDKIP